MRQPQRDAMEVILLKKKLRQSTPTPPAAPAYIWAQDFSETGTTFTQIRGLNTAWVTATGYVIGQRRSVSSVNYICTANHTSGAATQPGIGASWATVWGVYNRAYPSPVGANAPAWALTTLYTPSIVRRNSSNNHYRCILLHTSAATDEPGVGVNWATYWVQVFPAQVVNAAAEGLTDWPSTNAYRIDFLNTWDGFQNMMTRQASIIPGTTALTSSDAYGPTWTTLAIGETIYFRLCMRWHYPNAADPGALGNGCHPWEERQGTAGNWSNVYHSAAAGISPRFLVYPSASPTRFVLGPSGLASPIYLSRDVTYYYMFAITRTGANTRTHQIRVLDSSFSQLYTEANFFNEVAATTPLTGHSAAFNTSGAAPNGVDAIGFHQLGLNGPNLPGMLLGAEPGLYWGCVAVSKAGWPIQFQAGEKVAA